MYQINIISSLLSTKCYFTLSTGHFAVACLQLKRNAVIFYEEEDAGATITGTLAAISNEEEEE